MTGITEELAPSHAVPLRPSDVGYHIAELCITAKCVRMSHAGRYLLKKDFEGDLCAILMTSPARSRSRRTDDSENSKANRIETMKGPTESGQICSGGRRKIAKK
jgi:hypothetical protein